MQKQANGANPNLSLSSIEKDTIGEIMNISMGAAATAVSVLLNRKVSITTPVVSVIAKEAFEYKKLEPAIGVEINYLSGLSGSNLMIMNSDDARAIVAALQGEEIRVKSEPLDEIHLSALGEVMNQMMGSASTALATFFGKSIDISPPKILDPNEFYKSFFDNESNSEIVAIGFKFVVEGLVDNSFVTVLPVSFTKELVGAAFDANTDSPREPDGKDVEVTGHRQIPETVFSKETEIGKDAVKQASPAIGEKKSFAPDIEKERRNVNVREVMFESFGDENYDTGPEQVNFDLVMDVELNIMVEIGHAKKPVREVLNLAKGSIIELDKKAGEPVDIIVNGQLIAKGDVVVIDDNFGVRITQVLGVK
ncbi:MAG: flagellar motor switch phosphatase FliY [Eubacteriales bacterium]